MLQLAASLTDIIWDLYFFFLNVLFPCVTQVKISSSESQVPTDQYKDVKRCPICINLVKNELILIYVRDKYI